VFFLPLQQNQARLCCEYACLLPLIFHHSNPLQKSYKPGFLLSGKFNFPDLPWGSDDLHATIPIPQNNACQVV